MWWAVDSCPNSGKPDWGTAAKVDILPTNNGLKVWLSGRAPGLILSGQRISDARSSTSPQRGSGGQQSFCGGGFDETKLVNTELLKRTAECLFDGKNLLADAKVLLTDAKLDKATLNNGEESLNGEEAVARDGKILAYESIKDMAKVSMSLQPSKKTLYGVRLRISRSAITFFTLNQKDRNYFFDLIQCYHTKDKQAPDHPPEPQRIPSRRSVASSRRSTEHEQDEAYWTQQNWQWQQKHTGGTLINRAKATGKPLPDPQKRIQYLCYENSILRAHLQAFRESSSPQSPSAELAERIALRSRIATLEHVLEATEERLTSVLLEREHLRRQCTRLPERLGEAPIPRPSHEEWDTTEDRSQTEAHPLMKRACGGPQVLKKQAPQAGGNLAADRAAKLIGLVAREKIGFKSPQRKARNGSKPISITGDLREGRFHPPNESVDDLLEFKRQWLADELRLAAKIP